MDQKEIENDAIKSCTYSYGAGKVLDMVKMQHEMILRERGFSELESNLLFAVAQGGMFSEQRNLDKVLGISRVYVSNMVNDMVNSGLMVKKKSSKNAQSYALALTDDGWREYTWLVTKGKEYDDVMMKGFTQEEKESYVNMSIRMSRNLMDMSGREMSKIMNEHSSYGEEDRRIIISEEDKHYYLDMVKKLRAVNEDNLVSSLGLGKEKSGGEQLVYLSG